MKINFRYVQTIYRCIVCMCKCCQRLSCSRQARHTPCPSRVRASQECVLLSLTFMVSNHDWCLSWSEMSALYGCLALSTGKVPLQY
jgi:hypothetical protein